MYIISEGLISGNGAASTSFAYSLNNIARSLDISSGKTKNFTMKILLTHVLKCVPLIDQSASSIN
jgi:hypothetical protein